jgi:quinol monooxygenase YgiN
MVWDCPGHAEVDFRCGACHPGSFRRVARDVYGLIGRIRAAPGQRDALISILLEGIENLRGCLSSIVAKDPKDPAAVWVTEVWDSPESHQGSLSLPSVRQAIARGKPLIAGFFESFTTAPVGGRGLVLTPFR